MTSLTRRSLLTGALAAVAVTATACGGGGDPLAAPSSSAPAPAAGEIIVGSANFTESQVLGELYTQALRAKGLDATSKPNIGTREVYLAALKDGSIGVVPEYTGNLLLYFDAEASAKTAEEIEKALPDAVGSGLAVLPAAQASDQDVYVVIKAYADEHQLASLADLKKVSADAVLGGPSELQKRSYGPPGLEKIYGATFKSFRQYDSPAVKVKDLNDNKIQVATFFTTESAILDNGYVQLSDPESMILPQNIVPLVRDDVAGNAEAKAALDGVQRALSTEELTALNKQVDVERKSAAQVAGEWLKGKGLA